MRKLYLILSLFAALTSRQAVHAENSDTTVCNAAFQATIVDSLVSFRAMDSMPGVQHLWNFGDGTTSTLGPATAHYYNVPGTYAVTQIVIDSAQHCQDSSTQMITIGQPGPTCGVYISFSGDATGQVYHFIANPGFSGGSNYTVSWMVNDTLAGSGDTLIKFLPYGPDSICASLRVFDANNNTVCTARACIAINPLDSVSTQPPPPPDTCTISFTAVENDHTPNQYVFTLLDGERYDSISWTIMGPDSLVAGPYHNGSFSYTFPDTGYYDVYVTADARPGCWVRNGQAIHVDSIAKGSGNTTTSYPNPATTQVTMSVTLDGSTTVEVRVYNSMGGQVLTRTVTGSPGINQITLPISNLPPGIYYVEMKSADSTLRSKFQKL